MKAALIIFAKKPLAGKVKTRLTSLLDPEEAALLYTAFLQDALIQYQSLAEVDLRLYVSPPDVIPDEILPFSLPQFFQTGGDLGERMLLAFLETFKVGYERIVIIGTDHPSLPTLFIDMAFEALQERDQIVIGPSEDGGYYLLGMNTFYPLLFEEMSYSHSEVFKETTLRASYTEGTLNILPSWYDVDEPKDLKRLAEELQEDDPFTAHTRAFVQFLTEKYPALR